MNEQFCRDAHATPYGLVDWTKRLISISDWSVILGLAGHSPIMTEWVNATNNLLTAMGVEFDPNRLVFSVGLKTNEDLQKNLLSGSNSSFDLQTHGSAFISSTVIGRVVKVESVEPPATPKDPLPWWKLEFQESCVDGEGATVHRLVSLKVEAETWYEARELARIHLKTEIPNSATWTMIGTPPVRVDAGTLMFHYNVLRNVGGEPKLEEVITGALEL